MHSLRRLKIMVSDDDRTEYKREWREANRAKVLETKRRYREANKERIRAAQKEWRAKNKAHRSAYNKAWTEANRDKARARELRYYARNKVRLLAKWQAEYRQRKSKKAIRVNPDEVYRHVMKAVPRALPKFMRDDIVSNMLLAILEGDILIKNIDKEVKKFLTSYNREYDTFKTKSLDAPIAGTDGMTMLDTLTYDQYDDDSEDEYA